jgi:hypothetical protein
MRQNHLIIDGWRILRFSYDDVSEKPRMCEQILQQFMGSWIGAGIPSRSSSSDIIETEVLRLALRMDRFLRPGDICDLLQVQKDKARDILHSLLRKQYLLPAGRGVQRIRCYKVNREQVNERNWLL